MKKEIRIKEIMKNFNVERDVAETMFLEEICEKYGTDNAELAEAMFNTD